MLMLRIVCMRVLPRMAMARSADMRGCLADRAADRQWDIKKSLFVHIARRSSGLFAEPVGDQRSSAVSASSACGPAAVTRMQQPGLAASIIRPMIDVPPTVMPSFATVTLGIEAVDDLDELGRGARMQAALVDDQQISRDQTIAPMRAGAAHLPLRSWLATLMYLRPASAASSTAPRHVVVRRARWQA